MAQTNSEADIWLRTMLPEEDEVLSEKAGAILKLRLSARDLARAEELGLKVGFLGGTAVGARLATRTGGPALRWGFIGVMVAMAGLLALRG
jgi:uncharacterized membrane protein YfcA